MSKQLAEILEPFEGKKGVTIPVLQQVQEELGYLPREAINEIAKALRISASEIYGVITFYAQFRTAPRGKHVVRVCRGTACHVRGGGVVLDQVKIDLGIEENESTEDMEYTLETVACIGACALAPAMVIDEDTFGKVSPGKISEIIASRKGDNQNDPS
ncbi:NADH-quinone oxidoreductase subunit NuoE [Chloroflexota bacterium]